MIVVPDAQILWTNAAFRQHGRRFGENQARAANGAASEMHEVPVVSEAVLARILTHGRNGNAIGKLCIAKREWFKEMGHRFSGKSFVGKPRVDYRLASRPGRTDSSDSSNYTRLQLA